MRLLSRFVSSCKFKVNKDHGRMILDTFMKLMKGRFSLDMVEFFDNRSIKELQYLLLKCKEDIKEPDRIISFLNTEINRRIQSRVICISLFSMVISVVALVKSFLR